MNNTVFLKMDRSLFNEILSLGIDIRDCVLEPVKKNIKKKKKMTETEYITSTKANKEALDQSLDDLKNGRVTEFKIVNGVLQEV